MCCSLIGNEWPLSSQSLTGWEQLSEEDLRPPLALPSCVGHFIVCHVLHPKKIHPCTVPYPEIGGKGLGPCPVDEC